MNTFIFPLIMCFLAEEVFSKKCNKALWPHKSNDTRKEQYERFKDCGVEDKNEVVECSGTQSCYTTDFWINGVNDKPLTIHSCGRLDEKGLNGKPPVSCTAVCEKDVFMKEFNMKKYLKDNAKNPGRLAPDCLNFLTTIDAISVSKCGEGLEKCQNMYCKKKAAAIPKENCKKTPSKTTATAVAAGTANSNQTGNATTSGGAKIIPALLSMSYFALTFVMKWFL